MSTSAEPVVRMPVRVRFHECDPQGIVFNANYLAYADMASFEFVRAAFGSYETLLERERDFVVAESNLRYRAACHPGDDLIVSAVIEHIGTTSLVLEFRIHRHDDLVVSVTNRYVFVGTGTMRPAALPDDLRQRLLEIRDGAPAAGN
jgi:acyl-CoA thioester hydrolase